MGTQRMCALHMDGHRLSMGGGQRARGGDEADHGDGKPQPDFAIQAGIAFPFCYNLILSRLCCFVTRRGGAIRRCDNIARRYAAIREDN